MAKAKAVCTCETCGATFYPEKHCYNRKEANEWEARAVEYFTECGDCYSARKKKEAEVRTAKAREEVKAYTLPEVQGVSEKQKKYAVDLRAKFIVQNKEDVEFVQDCLAGDGLDEDVVKTEAEKQGKSEREIVEIALREMGFGDALLALTCTDAGKIIDKLR